MAEFKLKSLCILGRQPALGLAELESLYGAEHVYPVGFAAGDHSIGVQPVRGAPVESALHSTGQAALLDIDAGEINFKRLGGSIKVAQVLATLPSTDWKDIKKYLLDNVPKHLTHVPPGKPGSELSRPSRPSGREARPAYGGQRESLLPGKFTLGLSFYGLAVPAAEINKLGISIKRASDRPMRVVPNKSAALNSAQVLHNKLTSKGAWELLLVKNGQETILAQTFFVQDLEAYGARDQARPRRDARVGMLPPKLAQIIINLAVGPIERKVLHDARLDGAPGDNEQRSKPYNQYGERAAQLSTQRSAKSTDRVAGSASQQVGASRIRVLDPFCGTGVILQEAALMGYHVLGSDIDSRMVEYTKENLAWLVKQNPQIEVQVSVEIADATNTTWPRFSVVASEIYLGRPLNNLPPREKLQLIINDVNTITKKFLLNIGAQTKPGQKMCLAVPAWKKPDGGFIYLPVLDKLTDMGYNYLDLKHVPRDELLYYREDQVVARQLIIIAKR